MLSFRPSMHDTAFMQLSRRRPINVSIVNDSASDVSGYGNLGKNSQLGENVYASLLNIRSTIIHNEIILINNGK